ncbi:MAG: hypothetical protein ACJ76H_04525 [Bacteriovoracaceae bacterium]
MDWKKTFAKGNWVMHGIFLVAILSIFGTAIFALRLSQYQSTEIERTSKVKELIEFMKTDDSFVKISKYLSWAQAEKAFEKMKEVSAKMAETETLLEVRPNAELQKSVRTFNSLITDGSGMSDPSDALKVMTTKIHALADVARSNGFKRISTIAEKMQSRLSNVTAKTVAGSVQVSYLKTDLRTLTSLVTNSTLTDGEKKGLLGRFQSIEQELNLLSSLSTEVRGLKGQVTTASLAMAKWTTELEKKALTLADVPVQKQKHLIIFLFAIVGVLLTAWMGVLYLFRWQKITIGMQVENEVKKVIETGILADQRFMMDHYTESTREDIVRLLDDLKVKLNLGSMLHEGLPFGGCMLDNNFKVTWFNQLFLEQFYLSPEEVRSEAFHWDYLREYLNLADDPVYEALVNKVAGIYPVKIKQDELAPAQPFEMYVTPITLNREDRVMVFFYPLVAVKDAINEQVNLSREVMRRFVDLWNTDALDDDELALLEKDFTANNLDESFQELRDLHHRISMEKNEYIRTIQMIEHENSNLRLAMEEISKVENEKKDIIRKEMAIANDLKTSLITVLEKNESLTMINKGVLQQNDELRTEAMRIQEKGTESMKRVREVMDMVAQIDGLRGDYKKLKFELMECKARLVSMNNSLFAQLPPLDENQQKLAIRYKDELARLDVNVSLLEKKLGMLDVLVGKMNMMNDTKSTEQIAFNFQTTQKDHALKETIHELQKIFTSEEARLVDNLQTLRELMKQDLEASRRSQELAETVPEQPMFS